MTPFWVQRVVCFEPLSCNIIIAWEYLFINIFLNSPYSESLFVPHRSSVLPINQVFTDVETKWGLYKKLEWYWTLHFLSVNFKVITY